MGNDSVGKSPPDNNGAADAALETAKLWREGARDVKEAEELKDEREMRRLSGQRVDLNLRTPKDIFRTAIAPPFEFDEVPVPIAKLAWNFEQATGFDRSGVLVAAVVGAASVIADQYRLLVRERSEWYESARLWAVLLGEPSTGKSPSIRAATNIIKAIHDAEHILWAQANKGKGGGEDRDPEPALYTSDTTVEALSDVLIDNPRGILMLTEEFDSWIGNVDSADKAQAARNRGQWLELYDGGSRQVNRVQRGRVLVPNWSASVLAAGTPVGLQKHMRSLPQDGLIHRFVPVLMGLPNFNATGDAREAIREWSDVIRKLRMFTSGQTIQMDAQAQQVFDTEERHKRYLGHAVHETSAALASHLGKHPGLLARVALTFHAVTDVRATHIDQDTMWKAIMFCRKVSKHWSAMSDGILSTSPALSMARALGRSIVAESGTLTTVGRAWMSAHCAEFRKETDDRVKQEAVHILEDADWIEPVPGLRSYGGWPTSWNINFQLFQMFSKEGEAWRARRAAVKEAIGMNDRE